MKCQMLKTVFIVLFITNLPILAMEKPPKSLILSIKRVCKLNPALFKATKRGDINEVKRLLDLGANPNAQNVKKILTPLTMAAYYGHLEVCNTLLKYGANLHSKDGHGRTAFLSAASQGHAFVCRFLLDNGANYYDLDSSGNDFNFSVHWWSNNLEMCKLEMEQVEKIGRKIMLEDKSKINSFKTSLLHESFLNLALNYLMVEFVQELIEAGADINYQDYLITSPLSGIIDTSLDYSKNEPVNFEKSIILAKSLLQAGCQINNDNIQKMQSSSLSTITQIVIAPKYQLDDSEQKKLWFLLCCFKQTNYPKDIQKLIFSYLPEFNKRMVARKINGREIDHIFLDGVQRSFYKATMDLIKKDQYSNEVWENIGERLRRPTLKINEIIEE